MRMRRGCLRIRLPPPRSIWRARQEFETGCCCQRFSFPVRRYRFNSLPHIYSRTPSQHNPSDDDHHHHHHYLHPRNTHVRPHARSSSRTRPGFCVRKSWWRLRITVREMASKITRVDSCLRRTCSWGHWPLPLGMGLGAGEMRERWMKWLRWRCYLSCPNLAGQCWDCHRLPCLRHRSRLLSGYWHGKNRTFPLAISNVFPLAGFHFVLHTRCSLGCWISDDLWWNYYACRRLYAGHLVPHLPAEQSLPQVMVHRLTRTRGLKHTPAAKNRI